MDFDTTFTLGDLGAAAAVLVALAALGTAIWSAIVSTKALGAAERSADAATRSADADEEMVRLARGEADSPEEPWHLVQDGRHSYRLMNNSNQAAEDVHIGGSVEALNFEDGDTIGPRSSVRLLDTRSLAESNPVSVTWSRPGSTERLNWVRPL